MAGRLGHLAPFISLLKPSYTPIQVSLLLESWYSSSLEDSASLVSNCLLYLLERSFSPTATKTDVKRVWSLHQAILGFRLQDQAAQGLKQVRNILVLSSSWYR